jgi:hypothetical protein
MQWKLFFMLALAILLLGCAKEKAVGGYCNYLTYEGTCKVINVSGSPPVADFTFTTDPFNLTNESVFVASVVKQAISSGYPGQAEARFLDSCYAQNISCSIQAKSVPCVMVVLKEGTCTPVAFFFDSE